LYDGCVGAYFFPDTVHYDGIHVLASAPGSPIGECCPPNGAILGAAPATIPWVMI